MSFEKFSIIKNSINISTMLKNQEIKHLILINRNPGYMRTTLKNAP